MAKNKKPTLRSHKFGIFASRVYVVLVILGMLYILVAVTLPFIRYKIAKNNQKQKFEAAKAACHEDPVVVVKTVTYLFGGDTSYKAYLPTSTHYASIKTIVRPPISFLGYDAVQTYYCSLEEAKDASVRMNWTRGYSLTVDPRE